MSKFILSTALAFALLFSFTAGASADGDITSVDISVSAKSAVLIEGSSDSVIYEKNKRIVKSSTGYPTFLRIHIEKKNCKEPKKNNENNSDFPIDKSSEK